MVVAIQEVADSGDRTGLGGLRSSVLDGSSGSVSETVRGMWGGWTCSCVAVGAEGKPGPG